MNLDDDVGLDEAELRFPKERFDLKCGDCGAGMTLRSSPKYPHPFYGCDAFPTCRGTHGAHPDGSPKGRPADAPTRAARIRAHKAFDLIWKTKIVPRRTDAYRWLREQMGLSKAQAHISMFTSEQCEEVVKRVFLAFPSLANRYERLSFLETETPNDTDQT